MKTLIFLLLLQLTFLGCSSKNTPYQKRKLQQQLHTKMLLRKPSPRAEFSSVEAVLYDEYSKWRGVKYCYGGVDKSGIDCSAFVQTIYYDAFGLHLPRTTKEQAKVGYFVKKTQLQAGDLLLFKTGYNSRHSAIYIEKGDFLHVSTKHGVSISNIHNPYWRSRYWQARRVLVK